MQESREFDPEGLGRRSAGDFPIRGQASLLCLLTYFPHGSRLHITEWRMEHREACGVGTQPFVPAAFSSPLPRASGGHTQGPQHRDGQAPWEPGAPESQTLRLKEL